VGEGALGTRTKFPLQEQNKRRGANRSNASTEDDVLEEGRISHGFLLCASARASRSCLGDFWWSRRHAETESEPIFEVPIFFSLSSSYVWKKKSTAN
jgi:hypothetical protein